MSGWLTSPIELHSSRAFDCEGFTTGQCDYYMYRWRFWYQADHVFALPTVAFFMCAIGIFIIGHLVSSLALWHRKSETATTWQRVVAAFRYLSYRGFHVRQIQWNSAPVGLLVLAAVGTTFFFCMDLIPQPYYWSSEMYGGSPPLGTRSGWMALACMPFVFATASKASWITLLTGVPHEKLQVFHRWISYAFFVLALLHTFPFIVYHIRFHDMEEQVNHSSTIFYWTGTVALIFQAWLTFASFSTIRALGYEFFKMAHFLAVIVFVLIFFWHCDYTLTSWDYFIATAAVYVPSLVYPWLRTFLEYGGRQKAQVSVEDNGFTCITIPAKFRWVPGQHCFLRFTGFGVHALTSHPFTICSIPTTMPDKRSDLVFYIRHQQGFTARLYDWAIKHPGSLQPVLVDGPYGGINLQQYYASDHLLVVAGGSGAGWILPFIELFALNRFMQIEEANHQHIKSESGVEDAEREHLFSRDPSGPTSLRVILATRDTSTREWFYETVSKVLARYPTASSSSNIQVQVFLTGDAQPTVDFSGDATSSTGSASPLPTGKKVVPLAEGYESAVGGKETCGRPRLPCIIQEEASKAAQTQRSLGVFACGPIDMQNDVRNAVAQENLGILKNPRSTGVYLHLEHFSWA